MYLETNENDVNLTIECIEILDIRNFTIENRIFQKKIYIVKPSIIIPFAVTFLFLIENDLMV